MSYAQKIAKSEFRAASSRAARNGTQPTTGSGNRNGEAVREMRRALHATIAIQRKLARIDHVQPAKRDDKEKRERRADRYVRKVQGYALRVASETRGLDMIAKPLADGIATRFARTSYAKRPAMIARAFSFCASRSVDLARAVLARLILTCAPIANGNAIRVSLYRLAFEAYQAITGQAFACIGARAVSVGNLTRSGEVSANVREARAPFDGARISQSEINRRASIVGDSGSVVSNNLIAKRRAETVRAMRKIMIARGASKAHIQSAKIESRKVRAIRPKVFQSINMPALIGSDGSLIRAPYVAHEWVDAPASAYVPMYDHAGRLIF